MRPSHSSSAGSWCSLSCFARVVAVATSSVHGLSIVISTFVQWASPLYYWSLGVKGASSGDMLLLVAGIAGKVLLAAGALLASHHVLRARGVRP